MIGVALRLLTFAAVLAVIVLAPLVLMIVLALGNRRRERIYRDRDKPFDWGPHVKDTGVATVRGLNGSTPPLCETPEEREARHRRMQIGGGGIRAAITENGE